MTRLSLFKGLWTVTGTIFVGLGILGILLPVLPTVPFLLLAAGCYFRGSEKIYKWFTNNRWFGHYLKDYREGKGISLKVKIFLITFLIVSK